MFRTLKVFCHYQGKKSQLLRLWFSSNYKEDERVFILKTESCLWLGGSIKLYMIKWSSQMNENVPDEREAENTYLVLFTSFSSFLCSASLENERQIFPSAFSRLLCPFLSLLLAKKKHQKRMGSRRKGWSIPPSTHTALPVAFSSGSHLFCGFSSPPGPVAPPHSFQCWMIMLSASAFSRLSSYTLVVFSSFSYI